MIPVRLPIRKAMAEAAKGAPSHLEALLATQLALAGLKGVKTQFKAIPGRQFKWDFAFPESRLLIEVQGGTFSRKKSGHKTGMGINRDCEKSNLAVIAGWRVLAFDTKHIHSGQALAWIQLALKEAA